jgi:acetyltransferase-like isoleucine patch superfamily enzyme
MDLKRAYHSIRMFMCRSAEKRAAYLKKHNILGGIGENCRWGPWKIPLYPKLIILHNNVGVQKTVSFITHDMVNRHLKGTYPEKDFGSKERIGCIELMDNVYISTRVILMHDIRVNKNSIVTAMSVVTSDIPENSVATGNPAKPVGRYDMFSALRSMSKGQIVDFKNQKLPDELAEKKWKEFYKKRNL